MRIVLSTASLGGLGGSETYAVTVADHLQRLGHEVWLHSFESGEGSALAEHLGVRTRVVVEELPDDPDAVIVQDGAVSYALARRFPQTPQLFVAHSDIFDLQLPPQLPDLVTVVVTLYDRVDQRVRAMAAVPRIVRLTQPIDVDRYKPTRPLRERARVALVLSNYLDPQRMNVLSGACAAAGIELRHAGGTSASGPRDAIEAINEADIVFGKARVIYEAMACARAAYVFDHNGGDGWVTTENVDRLARDNFGGQSGTTIDHARLLADLQGYDPGMGTVNRDYVISHNAATRHAAALVETLRELTPRASPEPTLTPLEEMARLVRLYHRADAEAFALRTHMAVRGQHLHELEIELTQAREREGRAEQAQAQAEQDLTAARAEALAAQRADEAGLAAVARELSAAREDAAAAWGRFHELATSRRWRALQSLLSPWDQRRAGRG